MNNIVKRQLAGVNNYISTGSQSCVKCGGLIMEPNKAYGYAGPVCHCIWTEPYNPYVPSNSGTIIVTTTTSGGTENESPFLIVDKVENGFIVTKDGKEYIAKTAEEVIEFLKDDAK